MRPAAKSRKERDNQSPAHKSRGDTRYSECTLRNAPWSEYVAVDPPRTSRGTSGGSPVNEDLHARAKLERDRGVRYSENDNRRQPDMSSGMLQRQDLGSVNDKRASAAANIRNIAETTLPDGDPSNGDDGSDSGAVGSCCVCDLGNDTNGAQSSTTQEQPAPTYSCPVEGMRIGNWSMQWLAGGDDVSACARLCDSHRKGTDNFKPREDNRKYAKRGHALEIAPRFLRRS